MKKSNTPWMEQEKVSEMGYFYAYSICQGVIFKEISNKYLYIFFLQITCYFVQKYYNGI